MYKRQAIKKREGILRNPKVLENVSKVFNKMRKAIVWDKFKF